MDTALPSLLSPGDPGWDDARTAWNLAVDQRPAAVALPRSAQEMAAAVGVARERGLRIAVQGSGHGAGRVAVDDGVMLIRTRGLSKVRIDAAARRAHLGAGVAWGDVTGLAAEHGLAAASGSAATVCPVGYLTGGGHGWLAGRHGLGANDLLAVELVTADGEILRIDDTADDEVMWALRGGGGGFAAITAVEVGLHEVGDIAGGGLFWPIERAGEVLEAWRSWSGSVPAGVTTIGRLLRFPPIEPVPEPLRGRSFVVVEAVDLEGIDRLGELLGPLFQLGPEMDMIRPMRPTDLWQVHMDPPEPVPSYGGGMLLDPLPAEAVAAVVEAGTEGPGAALLGAEIRRLGGPVARARAEGVVCAVREAAALYCVGIAATPELQAAAEQGVDAVRGALAPWASPRSLPNLAAEADPVATLFPPDDLARLTAVADRLDPDGVFLRRG